MGTGGGVSVGTFPAARPTTKGSFLEYLRALGTGELDGREVCGLLTFKVIF